MIRVQDILNKVKYILNEADYDDGGLVEGSYTEVYSDVSLDDYILRMLPDAVRLVYDAVGRGVRLGVDAFAEVDASGIGVDGKSADVSKPWIWRMHGEWDIDKPGVRCMVVEVPEGAEVEAVRVRGWGREVREVSKGGDVRWRMQYNPYVGGSRHAPLVTEVVSPRGRRAVECRPVYWGDVQWRRSYPLLRGRYGNPLRRGGWWYECPLEYLLVRQVPKVVNDAGVELSVLVEGPVGEYKVDLDGAYLGGVSWLCAGLVSGVFEHAQLSAWQTGVGWSLVRGVGDGEYVVSK